MLLVAHRPTWKPPWAWTMPLGLPVEPEVYRMKSGCEASTGVGGTTRQRTPTSAASESEASEWLLVAAATASIALCAWPSIVGAGFMPSNDPSTLMTTGGSAATSAASTASRASVAHVMRTEAPMSSRRKASVATEVPPATATNGMARRLAAWTANEHAWLG